METISILNGPAEMLQDAMVKVEVEERVKTIDSSLLYRCNFIPKGTKKSYFRFHKVVKNDTAVKEVSTNDFKMFQPTLLKIKGAIASHFEAYPTFFLPDDDAMFYGFLSRVKAMEFAKAGALKYISKLIDDGEKSYDLLIEYRATHYDDLNIHLTDRNIRRIELKSRSN